MNGEDVDGLPHDVTMGKQVDRWVLLLVEKIFSFFPTSTHCRHLPTWLIAACTCQNLHNKLQMTSKLPPDHVFLPIILEILDHEDEQLAAKVKQQQAELKAMDALEHAWESKRKVAEEVAECKHEKKATCEMDEMACLERMQEQREHDVCHGLCMLVGQSSSITSTTDNAWGTQKCKAMVDTSSIDHEQSAFGQGTKSCLTIYCALGTTGCQGISTHSATHATRTCCRRSAGE